MKFSINMIILLFVVALVPIQASAGLLLGQSPTSNNPGVNPCQEPSPCENGGICLVVSGSSLGFSCSCTSRFVGAFCEGLAAPIILPIEDVIYTSGGSQQQEPVQVPTPSTLILLLSGLVGVLGFNLARRN